MWVQSHGAAEARCLGGGALRKTDLASGGHVTCIGPEGVLTWKATSRAHARRDGRLHLLHSRCKSRGRARPRQQVPLTNRRAGQPRDLERELSEERVCTCYVKTRWDPDASTHG